MITQRIRTAAAALVVAAGLLASGCASQPPPVPTVEAPAPTAAPPTAEAPSQAEQCAQLVTDVQGIAGDVPRIAEMLGTDPFGALALVGDISGRVGALDLHVTDPELVQRIDEIQAGWDAVVQDAQDSLASGDVGALERISAAVTALGQQVSDLQQLCTGGTP